MSVADTARLLASLELQDKFSKPAAAFDRAVGGMEARTNTLGRIGSQVGRGLGAAANNLRTIGTVGAGVIAANVVAGIQSLARLEVVTAATNAVIESTGGIAGITADKVRELAEKFEGLNATMDDKVIQNAENLLLTFTGIGEKAFEPALQAALDLNQAMGGGEEGLQQTIIQVGKALNDPIRGAAALRKVGLSLTQQQQDQIKTLVEQNRLYDAQQIILGELSTEFGGQFAAAGDTATGKFAALQDAVEGAQQSLATAFLPVMEKVGAKLSTFLSDPQTIARIEDFGKDLAGGLDQVIEIGGQLPWASIGSAFELAGSGAKAVLSAFTSMPPWVQTAVLTGWGLNKLTGGMFGGIVGELGKGLIKGVLGMNAGVVNVTGGVVNAPGGAPVAPSGGAGLGNLAAGIIGTAGAVAVVAGGIQSIEDIQSGTRDGVIDGMLSQGVVGLITNAVEGPISELIGVENGNADQVAGELKTGFTTQKLTEQQMIQEYRTTGAATQGYLSSIATQTLLQSGKLDALNAKDPQIINNITIPISTFVNSSLVGQQLLQQQISSGYGSGHGGPVL